MQDYLNFWKINKPAFNRSGEDAHYFTGGSLEPIVHSILGMARQPRTISAISASEGCGKSALARWLHQTIDYENYECLLIQALPYVTHPNWVIEQILDFLTAPPPAETSKTEKLQLLSEALDQLLQENRTLILLVDEAHNLLNEDNTSELELLLGLQGASAKCLSIQLFLEASREYKLDDWPELNRAITFRVSLPIFTTEDTKAFLAYECQMAGIKRNPFDDKACESIHRATHGNPGEIARIGELALIQAAISETHEISLELLDNLKSHNILLAKEAKRSEDSPQPAAEQEAKSPPETRAETKKRPKLAPNSEQSQKGKNVREIDIFESIDPDEFAATKTNLKSSRKRS